MDSTTTFEMWAPTVGYSISREDWTEEHDYCDFSTRYAAEAFHAGYCAAKADRAVVDLIHTLQADLREAQLRLRWYGENRYGSIPGPDHDPAFVAALAGKGE